MKFSQKMRGFTLVMALAGLTAACGGEAPKEGSKIKITNGMEIPNGEFPSVVLLYDAAAGSICTGTFVTETIVLTAAHCSMSGRVDSDGNVDMTMSIIEITDAANKEAEVVGTSTKVVRNPQWDRNGKNVNRYDLGLVYFERGVARAVSEIASKPARSGDQFTIVGFGLSSNDQSTAGIKRMGENRVSSMSGGFIQFTGKSGTTNGDGTDSSAGSGDSGGPLFINGELAGVTSGGGWGGFGRTRSLYVDVHSDTSKEFLKKYLNY
ncbi:MAG: trypsin-like serine protease [Oligoflexus sp.]